MGWGGGHLRCVGRRERTEHGYLLTSTHGEGKVEETHMRTLEKTVVDTDDGREGRKAGPGDRWESSCPQERMCFHGGRNMRDPSDSTFGTHAPGNTHVGVCACMLVGPLTVSHSSVLCVSTWLNLSMVSQVPCISLLS